MILWWQNSGWREKQQARLELKHYEVTLGSPDRLFRHHNPTCRHDWTSDTIMHCDDCKEFTATVVAGKSAESVDE